jgi:hypothetical protein
MMLAHPFQGNGKVAKERFTERRVAGEMMD